MPLVIALAQVADRDAKRVGPKAARLARMLRAGLSVPPGFCIAGQAYREHILRNGLGRRVEEAAEAATDGTPDAKAATLARLRGAIAETPLAAELREEITHHWEPFSTTAVAVRSSATAEDLHGASFAGQHDSYLGVADLATCLRRVRDCWASLWSERAFEYRCRNGVAHRDAEMAVLVQSLVPAEAAGVMFTADPVSGRRDCAVIEAAFGLGEAVVRGKVAPDRIVVSKRLFRVERRITACKTLEIVPDASGSVRERAVEACRSSKPCLSDAAAGLLAQIGADVEALLGGPQDVEWALADGRLHVLQARPITALPPEPSRSWEDRQIWANVNLGEVAPDVMTPMTESLLRSLGPFLMGPVLRRLGFELGPDDLCGPVAGRIYFNLNTLMAIRRDLPSRLRQDASLLFGGGWQGVRTPEEVRIPKQDLPKLRARPFRRLTRLPELLWWLLRHPTRHGRPLLADLAARVTEMRQGNWPSLSSEDLVGRIVLGAGLPGEHMLADGAALAIAAVGMGSSLLLMELCRRWVGDENGALAKRLLSGLGGMEDAEAGIALWALAAMAQGDANVEMAVRQEDRFEAVARRIIGGEAGKAFLEAWARFMEAHGHHTRGELELANPRWAEQPDYVLGLLRSHIGGIGNMDPAARSRRLARQRRDLSRACLQRLRNPLKRLAFEAVLRRAQEGSRFRETLKSRTIRWMALIREMLLELGGRLVRAGALREREDVFFLRMAELGPATAGSFDPRPAVSRRRSEHERNAALSPPMIVFGRFDPNSSAMPVVEERSRTLHGLGASPGVARGKARVIVHAGEGHVLPGEVLVAPFTDPAWTPYFLNAAAVVMDQGGQLSHGSIVAREYGIPCVVNVGPASKVIPTGRLVEVDGTRGLVRLLDGPGDPPLAGG